MPTGIKPIQTRYKGHRFRSRLEARWAVFFNFLNIKYEYEMEGYVLPSGSTYLPDFQLPDLGVFVEVKPDAVLSYAELDKIVEFALEGDMSVLLIIGTPTDESMLLINRFTCERLSEYGGEHAGEMSKEDIAHDYLIALESFGSVAIGSGPFSRQWELMYKRLPFGQRSDLKNAYDKAKGARFEFGESG